jgi:pimeloyl-ACP methyl ester carboxylesterase
MAAKPGQPTAVPVPAVSYHDGPFGRVRTRAVGSPVGGLPEVVLIQGLGVSDYLLPALAELGGWTRAHLLDLPGLAGSGDPPYPLDLAGYAGAVLDWLAERTDGPVLLAGHSAGTQITARAAATATGTTGAAPGGAAPGGAAPAGVAAAEARRAVDVRGVVLASPTVDPVARGWVRLVGRFLWDGRREEPGLTRCHLPEWRRAGVRRLYRLTAGCLADRLEDTVAALDLPVLVLRGERDTLSTREWGLALAGDRHPASRYGEVGGAHSFVWAEPAAWSAPVHAFARDVADRTGSDYPARDAGTSAAS